MTTAHTSRAAYAVLLATGAKQTQEQRVYAAIEQYGPMTREQIADRTGIRLTSVCGRVFSLIEAGRLTDTGGTQEGSAGVRQKVVRLVVGQGELFQ